MRIILAVHAKLPRKSFFVLFVLPKNSLPTLVSRTKLVGFVTKKSLLLLAIASTCLGLALKTTLLGSVVTHFNLYRRNTTS